MTYSRTSDEVGFEGASVTMAHAVRARSLLRLHRDPFEGMLVVQAIEEGPTLVNEGRGDRRVRGATRWE